jgi:hypothetical protein
MSSTLPLSRMQAGGRALLACLPRHGVRMIVSAGNRRRTPGPFLAKSKRFGMPGLTICREAPRCPGSGDTKTYWPPFLRPSDTFQTKAIFVGSSAGEGCDQPSEICDHIRAPQYRIGCAACVAGSAAARRDDAQHDSYNAKQALRQSHESRRLRSGMSQKDSDRVHRQVEPRRARAVS